MQPVGKARIAIVDMPCRFAHGVSLHMPVSMCMSMPGARASPVLIGAAPFLLPWGPAFVPIGKAYVTIEVMLLLHRFGLDVIIDLHHLGWHLNVVGFLLHHDLRLAGNGDFDILRLVDRPVHDLGRLVHGHVDGLRLHHLWDVPGNHHRLLLRLLHRDVLWDKLGLDHGDVPYVLHDLLHTSLRVKEAAVALVLGGPLVGVILITDLAVVWLLSRVNMMVHHVFHRHLHVVRHRMGHPVHPCHVVRVADDLDGSRHSAGATNALVLAAVVLLGCIPQVLPVLGALGAILCIGNDVVSTHSSTLRPHPRNEHNTSSNGQHQDRQANAHGLAAIALVGRDLCTIPAADALPDVGHRLDIFVSSVAGPNIFPLPLRRHGERIGFETNAAHAGFETISLATVRSPSHRTSRCETRATHNSTRGCHFCSRHHGRANPCTTDHSCITRSRLDHHRPRSRCP
mmetsp:Transcript_75624/g.119852  ORF Transcript_75624/g.119852 Transcript_75624/m.119852 type:complete len:455 (-) Transcript_75624:78-1442(-)